MSYENIDYREANELFLTKVASASGIDELALAGTDFIRTKVQEESIADRIIPPQDFTAQELSVEIDKDRFFRIVDIKPEYAAQEVNWDAEPTGRYIKGKRGKVQYLQITTPWFQKTTQEIRTMKASIIDEIQQDGSKYFADVKDKIFLSMCDAAVGYTSQSTDDSANELSRTHFLTLHKWIAANRLKMAKVLLTDVDVRKAGTWPATDVGDAYASELTDQGGAIKDILEGFNLVKTIKTDILPIGHLYGYTTPEYLGYNEYLVGERPRLEIESRLGKIYWRVVGTTGMYVANAYAISKVIVKQ